MWWKFSPHISDLLNSFLSVNTMTASGVIYLCFLLYNAQAVQICKSLSRKVGHLHALEKPCVLWKRNAKKQRSTAKKTMNCYRHRGNQEHDSYGIVTVLIPSLPKIRMQIAFHYKQISHFNSNLKGNSGSCSKNQKEGLDIL